MTLFVLGVIADGIAEYGFDSIAKNVILELISRGESKESIYEKISRYPISSKLKSALYEILERFAWLIRLIFTWAELFSFKWN